MTGENTLIVPAPWALMGTGYIVLLKLTQSFVEHQGFVPEPLKGSFRGGLATVMYVDYTYSDAGPYRELLFIPGMFGFTAGNRFSITKIYVSTMKSVVSGQDNWGIPKELASFQAEQQGPSTERIRLGNGTAGAELSFRWWPVRLPVTTALVPPAWRTLAQHQRDRTCLTTIRARGSVYPARLLDARIDAGFFPDFTQGCILAVFKVMNFFMVFPPAQYLAIPGSNHPGA